VSLHVDAGPPAVILRRTAEDSGADLVVIGAHARGLVFDAVLGASRSIMHGVPGDLLVLRATRSA
jgi:nucleotide-binding universal stress UspA family protein